MTAANLAVASARAGRDVLLVDSDLRKPQLDEFFGIGRRPGLTDVALGQTELHTAVIAVPISTVGDSLAAVGELRIPRGTLTVLPAGLVPPDPGSLFEMKALADLLTTLRSRYDLVFIDSPPLLQVADGIALGSQADALIIVARAAKSRWPEVRKLRRALDTIPVPKLGVVVTGAEASADYADVAVYGSAAGERSRSEARPVPLERRRRV